MLDVLKCVCVTTTSFGYLLLKNTNTIILIFVNLLSIMVEFIHTDVRDLISIDDVMEDEDLKLGPNGGLVFCLE